MGGVGRRRVLQLLCSLGGARGELSGRLGTVNDHLSRPRAALAGVLAAAAALATGEFVTAFGDDSPSLVSSVGNRFIDAFAARLKELAVELFGTNDKPALVVGIVIVSLALGALLGLASGTRALAGPLGLAAFGFLGAWSYSTDPRGGGALGWVAAAAAVAVGCSVMWVLGAIRSAAPALAPAPDVPAVPAVPEPTPPMQARSSRRTFLVRSAVVGAGAVVLASSARSIRGEGNAVAARRRTVIPRSAVTRPLPTDVLDAEVPGVSTYLTPNDDFYRIDTALSVPDVNPETWELSITGLVDEPYTITYAELLELATLTEPVTIQCVSNEVGGDLVGTAVWQGVSLDQLLERAGVQPGATQIVGRSVDGWTAGFPSEVAFDGRVAMVAIAMNGEPLPVPHGFPARLIVSGLYGYVSATKWLDSIELTTWEDFDGYWVPRGWSKEGPIKIASRIDVPANSTSVAAGTVAVAGVAWAPNTGISAVEVQIDDGPWQPARLAGTASEHTWVQWVFDWPAAVGEYVLRVRATDADGAVQTGDRAEPAPDGATGWHTRRVEVR